MQCSAVRETRGQCIHRYLVFSIHHIVIRSVSLAQKCSWALLEMAHISGIRYIALLYDCKGLCTTYLDLLTSKHCDASRLTHCEMGT